MTFNHDPGSYVAFEYNGDLPIRSKSYSNNILVQTWTNFVSVSGSTITITYILDPAPNSFDTVILRYSFEGKNMTQYQTLLISNTGDDIDTRSIFSYTSDNLTGTLYRSFLNGIEGSAGIARTVKQTDDKFNPYSGLSPMNQAIIGGGSQVTRHGLHNTLQFESPTTIGGLYVYTYDNDGYALTMKEPSFYGSFETFTYNR